MHVKQWLLCCLLFFAAFSLQAAQTLKPFVRGSAQEIAIAHTGKPYILAFWSVSCVHCRAELEMLSKLGKRYPDLKMVLVATDPIAESAAVMKVLSRYYLAQAETWAFADDFEERLRFEVDRQWHGELPRSYLHGSDQAVTALSGKPDAAVLERWIKQAYLRDAAGHE